MHPLENDSGRAHIEVECKAAFSNSEGSEAVFAAERIAKRER